MADISGLVPPPIDGLLASFADNQETLYTCYTECHTFPTVSSHATINSAIECIAWPQWHDTMLCRYAMGERETNPTLATAVPHSCQLCHGNST